MLRPDSPLKANARSPPGQMACLSSPVSRRRLGSRTAVLRALLVVYNDDIPLNTAVVSTLPHQPRYPYRRRHGGRLAEPKPLHRPQPPPKL